MLDINSLINSLNFATIMPMLTLIIGGLFIICIDIINKKLTNEFYIISTIIFLVIALFFAFAMPFDTSFFDLILADGIARVSIILILITSILFLPLLFSKKSFHDTRMPEYFALFLFMLAGFAFMSASDNLILIFLGLETGSLALYTMIAMHNKLKSIEAAIKYFTLGALASGFFAFGAMLLYVVSGNIELNQIMINLSKYDISKVYILIASGIFLLSAIGFKLSLIPFHTWTPDVYEGSNTALVGFMSIVPKIAGFVVAIRVFETFMALNIIWINYILWIIVVITMTFSNLMALVQKDVKRMLSFSSISHAGFILSAVMIGGEFANKTLFLYWSMFLFCNLGAFAMLWLSERKKNVFDIRFDHPYEKFSGAIKVVPSFAIIMGIFMFSLSGIPPFSVFWGKFSLMTNAIHSHYFTLAVIMAINSAIAVYYYLKLVIYMFLKEPISDKKKVFLSNSSMPIKIVIITTFIITILSTIFISQIWNFLESNIN